MPDRDLGNSGYYIVTVANSIFIMANTDMGLMNGVNEFLYITLGKERFSGDTVIYSSKSVVKLPFINKTATSDIDMVLPSNRLDDEKTVHEMGMMTKDDIFAITDSSTDKVTAYRWHNSFKYLPYDTYMAAHPDWYSSATHTDESGRNIPWQICYTAHGNDAEYRLMLQTAYSKMKEYLAADPKVTTITFTIEDNEDFCQCPACSAKLAEYGSNSAVVIKFTNDLADMLKNDYPKVKLLFFAYKRTAEAPDRVDAYTACRDNVAVFYAPITANYTKSFYAPENAATANEIKKWAQFSENLYLWLYNTNFYYYLFPYNSFDAMVETNRFCKENNVKFIYWEGQWDQPSQTAFGTLKEYMNAMLGKDVGYTAEELYGKFFPAYFGAASGTMRTYFNELVAHMNAHPSTGSIYEPIGTREIWDKDTLLRWKGYIDTAYSQVQEGSVYFKHIKLESIFVRHALNALYGVEDTEFKSDCEELKVWYYCEVSNSKYECGSVSAGNSILW